MSDLQPANHTFNVLFLCTGNSARSILAESILSKDGAGRFHAFSAGSQPKGAVHPLALKVLQSLDYPIDGFRSKSWEEFATAMRQSWISCLRSVTTLLVKRAPSGRGSP